MTSESISCKLASPVTDSVSAFCLSRVDGHTPGIALISAQPCRREASSGTRLFPSGQTGFSSYLDHSSYFKAVFLNSLYANWISTGVDFVPQGTLGIVWRYFWLSQLEDAT